jgi:homocysteine S-methyltransferase
MTSSDHRLPQLGGGLFLCDGGLETTLVFLDGVDLPCFAAFPLLEREEGRDRVRRYFGAYLDTAAARRTGFVLDTPTWRANADWGEKLGYGRDDLGRLNRDSVAFARELARNYAGAAGPIVVNGVVGPRGDGYKAEVRMSAAEAEAYHRPQVEAFRAGGADMISAITMTYPEEAIGIARAAAAAGLPAAISFTVETDGRLPSGDSLKAAIEAGDAATGGAPAYYMINCAHPTHFEDALAAGGSWLDRIRGVRPNASTLSHAELDAATELDPGDPADLARRTRDLRRWLPGLCVVGGCCGTDHRHVAAICEACLDTAATA